jgi:hypothetical protein
MTNEATPADSRDSASRRQSLQNYLDRGTLSLDATRSEAFSHPSHLRGERAHPFAEPADILGGFSEVLADGLSPALGWQRHAEDALPRVTTRECDASGKPCEADPRRECRDRRLLGHLSDGPRTFARYGPRAGESTLAGVGAGGARS